MKNKLESNKRHIKLLEIISFILAAICLCFLLTFHYLWLLIPIAGNLLIFQRLFSIQKDILKSVNEAALSEKQAEQIKKHEKILELSIQKSKYLALQNQINPHFLYNTLDAIRGDALEMQMSQIADVTEALSTFFRYSISNMDKLSTVEEELGNIADYYLIQKYRFGSKLNLKIVNQDENDIYQYCLPRLSLQPLIENAISHGLEGREELGEIIVYLQRASSELIVCVVDDGVGMPYEQVDWLNELFQSQTARQKSTKKDSGGIALTNVNERIKLLFGEPYGLRVFSEEDIGTEIRLTVPAITRGEYEQERISEN